MKANQLTMRKLNEGHPQEAWHFDSVGNCGNIMFQDVVIIREPLGPNPGVCLPMPSHTMGILGLSDAIELVKKEREKLGIATQRA